MYTTAQTAHRLPILQIYISSMRKVAYLYNEEATKFEFSKQHPMKAKRIKMAHSLIQNYQLTDNLKMFHSKEATSQQMCSFHHPHYIKYLQNWVSPKGGQIVQEFLVLEEERKKVREDSKLNSIFKINQSFDCPGFDGLYNFCQLAVGASLDAADLIITGEADIAINWAGGYHHAKKTEASGFCYVNDIVVCILELLKVYPRVLYLDIDVHHGDGVEEAFYHTNRVMTVSFHEFDDDFFPGTGPHTSVGQGIGKYYTVNVPLKRGMDDTSYIELFKKVMSALMSSYRPDALVIQCGADSLAKDKLGHLNLSIKGHSQCLTHMKGYNVPMVLLGGGGYTIQNVSRCWAYETGAICGKEIDNKIPQGDYFYNYYGKDNYVIHFDVEKKENENSVAECQRMVERIVENMREAEMRPSISFHSAPKNFLPSEEMDFEIISDDDDSLVDDTRSEHHK